MEDNDRLMMIETLQDLASRLGNGEDPFDTAAGGEMVYIFGDGDGNLTTFGYAGRAENLEGALLYLVEQCVARLCERLEDGQEADTIIEMEEKRLQ